MQLRYLLTSLVASVVASPVANIEPRQNGVIYACTQPNTIALTFDDGPYIYTSTVLDKLKAAGMKATFFVNGQNWGNIYDNQAVVKRMIAEGHQIGSHTWSHPDLATLSSAAVTSQMTQLETALLSIIGKFPTYMRPPYFSYNSATLSTLSGLGYRVIQANIDTLDWQYNTAATTGQSATIFRNGVNGGGTISLAHDVHQTTANNLVPAMISHIQSRGLRAVTVGECLGDAAANWYRTSRGTTPPTNPPGGGTTTPDGTCGAAKGYKCPTNQYKCCSQWGWCGDTAEHCGAGCNPAYGICW